MEATEKLRFTSTLIPGRAYRISGFTCVPTDNWQQTLDNKTTLLFTRFTKFDPIPETGFPHHYFNFVAYNQLPYKVVDPSDKSKKEYPVLTGNVYIICFSFRKYTYTHFTIVFFAMSTDYIGFYMGSGQKEKWGSPMRKQMFNRKVEIQNLE